MAGRAIDAALDPKVKPDVAARIALDLFDATDPLSVLTLEAELPASEEGLRSLSLAQLETMAYSHGLNDLTDIEQEPG